MRYRPPGTVRRAHERVLGSHRRQHRRRLRRHRHEPALRAARSGDCRRRRRRRGDARGGARRALADHLGADRRRHAQIRRHPAARRQQGRGRHARADGAGAAAVGASSGAHRAARHHQRRAVLRRRHDHAGAVGALGDRRPQGRDAGVRSLRRAAHGRDPGRAVRGAVARHRARSRPSSGRSRWSGSSPSRSPALWHIADNPAVLLGAQSALRRRLSRRPRHDRPGHARRGVPGGDGRRGALRRSRPFRPQADPGRLARARAARACAQLSRPGRAGAGRSRRRSRIRSSCSIPTGRCCRWWCSPRPPP